MKSSSTTWTGILLRLATLWSTLVYSSTVVVASDMNTLMGVKGRDFVLLGGDNAFFRSVVIMDTEYHKVVEISDNILMAVSGEQGSVEVFAEWLKRNAQLMKLESSRPVGVRALAHFSRRNLADKLRKQGAGQAVSALLGGWDEASGQPDLFWLDALGALQSVPFGAHGLASRFALSLLDNGYHDDMSLDEARDLMESCFRQLERRYLVSSVGFSMKVVDRNGCRGVPRRVGQRRQGGRGDGDGGGSGGEEGGDDGSGGGGLTAVPHADQRRRYGHGVVTAPPVVAGRGVKTSP